MTRKTIRQRQLLAVLNLIREEGPISKVDISRKLRIRPATIDFLLKELEEKGLIKNDGKPILTNNRGRKPMAIELNKEAHYAVGVHFSDISIYFVVADLKGNIIREYKTDARNIKSKEDLVVKILDGIKYLLKVKKIRKEKVLGIGLGIPGSVDLERGLSLSYHFYPWWREIPFRDIVEEKFPLFLILDNDTRTFTLAERDYDSGKGVKNFLFLDLGILGIGLGIILNGELYYGKSGKAGEFGHITIEENGPLCTCGNYGCLESLCSGVAMEKEAKKLVAQGVATVLKEKEEITYPEIFKAVRLGDKIALQIVDRLGQHLGIGISTLINIFNPALVILGGYLAREGGDLLLPVVERTVKLRALPEPRSETVIKISHLPENSGALGAATLVLNRFFAEGESQVSEKILGLPLNGRNF
ncbi:MAG: ROK family transcriptional regulator [Candidatus Omnitrophota bacterium]